MRSSVDDSKAYLSAGQVARLLGVHRQTVYDRVRAGTLLPSARTAEGVMVFHREYIESIVAKEEKDQTVPG